MDPPIFFDVYQNHFFLIKHIKTKNAFLTNLEFRLTDRMLIVQTGICFITLFNSNNIKLKTIYSHTLIKEVTASEVAQLRSLLIYLMLKLRKTKIYC